MKLNSFARNALIVSTMAGYIFAASSATARNEWADYHWEFPGTETSLGIDINNCQQGTTGGLYGYNTGDHFSWPNDDWNDVITNTGDIVVADGACPGGLSTPSGDPIDSFSSRAPTYTYDASVPGARGTINAFNSDYGGTGWVGVAIVELAQSSGDNHIVYGEVHLNDYYAGIYSVYNDNLVMRKVQCQEVGHVLGLDHIKKDESCMYSSMAFIGAVYTPNGHDGEVVNEITHGHSGDVTPPPEEDNGPCANNPTHWKCQAEGRVLRGKATWAEHYGSEEDMFDAADIVVSARVLSGSQFDRIVGASGRGLPVSQAVLQIRETFKGNAKGVIRLEHTRGLGLEIVDDPGYVNGDEYMLFLRQIGANTFRTVNPPQGRIPL